MEIESYKSEQIVDSSELIKDLKGFFFTLIFYFLQNLF